MNKIRPRLLILTGLAADGHPIAATLSEFFDVDLCESVEQAMEALLRETYYAVFADVGDFLPLERALVSQQSNLVLDTIGEGVCVIDTEGICRWSNKRMQQFSPAVFEKVKQICCQAMSIFSAQTDSGTITQSAGRSSKKFAFQSEDDRYFELIASPAIDKHKQVMQIVAVVWDATSGRRMQQKIDAIDLAGRELTRLDRDAIIRISPSERLVLLRDKIIRYSKDLMHFDHFAVRLLDQRANKLEVVIAEGLPSEALEIDLYAESEGNGISGYVAATGRSYICHDAAKDSRYVTGMQYAKSSLTVPLLLHDKVVGVFNVESEHVGTFDEEDRQFAEIFGRYVGLALNILDLLVMERSTTTGRLADNVVQEMAQPLSNITTEAQTLIEEYIGDDTMRGRLNTIMENVSSIRHTMKVVAAGPTTVLGTDQLKAHEEESALRGKCILVVDDEQNIRETLDSILSKLGCHVSMSSDGYEAINLIGQQHFDLIISDIKLPHRNGYEIFAAARRVRDNFPVVLMTGFGYDPHHSIVRASQEGLSQVMFKPFKVNQLLEELHKALDLPIPEPKEADKH